MLQHMSRKSCKLKLRQVTRGIHTDCLLNYETVKYFGGEEHEGARYREAIREYQALEYKVISKCPRSFLSVCPNNPCPVSLNLLNLIQNFIIVGIWNYVREPLDLTYTKNFCRPLASLLDQ